MHSVAAIIPARFDATRFPGKPLALLNGKPVIHHVYAHTAMASRVDDVLVATDDQRIFDTVEGFGGRAVMTAGSHESGTDRIAEVSASLNHDIVVNVQGDEPFIDPEMIDDVVDLLYNDDSADICTLAKKTVNREEILSPNVVKVVFDEHGYALYFSRAPIPYNRDAWTDFSDIKPVSGGFAVFKHIGIYGYRRKGLIKFASLKQGRLEQAEKLEQLRALENGMKIKVGITEYETFGIDTIEDLRKAEQWQNTSL